MINTKLNVSSKNLNVSYNEYAVNSVLSPLNELFSNNTIKKLPTNEFRHEIYLNNMNNDLNKTFTNLKTVPIDEQKYKYNPFNLNRNYIYTVYIDRCKIDMDHLSREYTPTMFDNDQTEGSYVANCLEASNFLSRQVDNLQRLTFPKLREIHNLLLANTEGELLTVQEESKRYTKQNWESISELDKAKIQLANPVFNNNSKPYITILPINIGIGLEAQQLKGLNCKNYINNEYVFSTTNHAIQFRNMQECFDKRELKEIEQELEQHNGEFITMLYDDETEINKIYSTLLDEYTIMLKTAKTEDEIITATLIFLSRIEASHFFNNANSRLCFQILLPFLLKLHGITPSILYIPNAMAYFVAFLLVTPSNQNHINNISLSQLSDYLRYAIRDVKEGQRYFGLISND